MPRMDARKVVSTVCDDLSLFPCLPRAQIDAGGKNVAKLSAVVPRAAHDEQGATAGRPPHSGPPCAGGGSRTFSC